LIFTLWEAKNKLTSKNNKQTGTKSQEMIPFVLHVMENKLRKVSPMD